MEPENTNLSNQSDCNIQKIAAILKFWFGDTEAGLQNFEATHIAKEILNAVLPGNDPIARK